MPRCRRKWVVRACWLALALCAPILALGVAFAPVTFRWLAGDLPNNELAGLGWFMGNVGLACLAVPAVVIPVAVNTLRKELAVAPEERPGEAGEERPGDGGMERP